MKYIEKWIFILFCIHIWDLLMSNKENTLVIGNLVGSQIKADSVCYSF